MNRFYRMNSRLVCGTRFDVLGSGYAIATSRVACRKNFGIERGSALISTLLMIVVLTVIVTAFMQSMAVERRTAASYKSMLEAELAAEAGLAKAMNLLIREGAAKDMHFTLSVTNPNTENETIQMQVLRPDTTDVIESIPLISPSGGETTRIETGAIDSGGRIQRLAPFVPIEDSNGGGTEVARFAFWIDGDNFKQNVQLANRKDRNSVPLPQGVPLISPGGVALSASEKNEVKSLVEPLPTAATINQIVSANPKYDSFHATTYAPVENLTPEGWRKLNLTRLKRFIDGGTYEEDLNGDGNLQIVAAYPGLSAEQGPESPRFQLVKQLLNEDGNYPFNKENPWGPGNLEFIGDRFPDLDVNGMPTDARQAVANLIDYIDADVVPTTDGHPGSAIQISGADTNTGSQQRTVNTAAWEIPAAERHPAPTVMGFEARRQSNGSILGHPVLTAASVGLIFNPTGGGPQLNSSRVLGNVTVVNPWDTPIRWMSNATSKYILEMQVKMQGTAVNGARGAALHVPGSSTQGYFMNAWLAQYSGMAGSEFLLRSIAANSRVLFPRDWANNRDLANGPLRLNQPVENFRFNNFATNIELLRLIKRDDFGPVSRYLVQDLRVLGNLTRAWNPSDWSPTGGIKKVGVAGYGQTDWHLLTDPRLNFRQDSWTIASSTNELAPSPEIPVYTQLENTSKDIQQGLSNSSSWWDLQGRNHFPNQSNKDFRPSPAEGEPAMESYVELGFIATGRPWQTLRLYAETPNADTDIGLLNYVELGNIPARVTNEFGNPEVDGLINIASAKRESLIALFSEVTQVDGAEAVTLADRVIAIQEESSPFERVDDIFARGNIVNQAITDYEKEMLAAQIVPLATLRGRVFTVYSVGEARLNGRTVSRVAMRATVELRAGSPTGTNTLEPRILDRTIL